MKFLLHFSKPKQIEEGTHAVYTSIESEEVLKEVSEGETYTIISDRGDGWLEIQAGDNI